MSRWARGPDSDAGLSFHLKHGARIIKPIPNWRPGDQSNLGFGVLVTYQLSDLRFQKLYLLRETIENEIHSAAQSILMSPRSLDRCHPLMAAGFDSFQAAELVDKIGQTFDVELSQTIIFSYPSIERLAEYLFNQFQGVEKKYQKKTTKF